MSKSSGFLFSTPKLPDINSVKKVSFDDYLKGLENETLPSFPPKRLKELVRLVNENRESEISIFEWLDVIEDQQQWDDLSEREEIDACIATWKTIVTIQSLGDVALFKVALALDGKPSSIVSNLTNTLSIARTAKGIGEYNERRMDWLLALQQGQHSQLANFCYAKQKNYSELVKYYRLPQANSYFSRLSIALLNCVAEGHIGKNDDAWLNRNFSFLKSTKQKIEFCSAFINRFGQFDYGEFCDELISSYCLPTQEVSYWNRLDVATKQILKKKYKLSNYFDLRSISNAMHSDLAADELGFTEDQTKQIRSRSMFWSNYSSRFERVRVMLPKSTYQFVVKQNKGVPEFVDQISDESDFDSEVYIFEMGQTIAVEFLRGPLSETRFFKNNEWNSQRLFSSKETNPADIRAMSQLEVHDHGPFWQYFCETLLRTKLKITPDRNIPYFRGLPPDVNEYKDGIGLVVSPTNEMIQQRKEFLEVWVESFWASEVKTGKFGELRGLEQKSTLYLSKALTAKQLGDQETYDLFIKKAANQGNAEAMWQLGRMMLLGNKSDAKTRQHGEKWISQSAAKGHKEAMSTAERFRISF
ncbi:EH signature domain-containing protein [Vibrio fluvialis]|uniref:EH signature domain-containing protein n=1 Tax=Vibrio fluvialis TaxID=676 RepID=UPI001EEA9AC1|nr:EH signature domain-containing protein [Vibrio fluvialis]MCG6373397.1 EH signature domain-containing protein [Vibrio fluvialis]